MKRFLSKPYRWAAVYSILLTAAFTFVIMDTFVIEKSFAGAVSASSTSASAVNVATDKTKANASVTDSSYNDGNIKITIDTVRDNGSTVYIADIKVSDPSYLKTAFANGTYGRNIKETTSSMAEENKAIFAVNGDYYGFRNYGYVLKNGVPYRSTARSSGDDEALVIDKSGNFSIINESETSLASISSRDWQVLSFGPALIEDGKIVVDSSSEVSESMDSNPRTAIGQISKLHYIVVVSDGRTSESKGLSLLELAQVFDDRGCTVAYNLDGGGSSTMYFNGNIINKPTEGNGIVERKVSDIVYFGY